MHVPEPGSYTTPAKPHMCGFGTGPHAGLSAVPYAARPTPISFDQACGPTLMTATL